jgi:DNA-binding NarL/FixJ family response regulator
MTLDVLILGGANCLMSSALHELLRMDEQIGEVVLVDSQEEALHQLEQRTCVLMVVVVTYPIARFLSKLHRLGPGSPKTLLIFDATDKFALSHVSKFSVDGLITINSTYQEFRLAIRTIVARKMKYISPN